MLIEVFARLKHIDEMFSDTCLRNWVKSRVPNALSQVVDANLLKPGYQHFTEKLESITSIV